MVEIKKSYGPLQSYGNRSWTMCAPTVEKALKEKAGHMLKGIIFVESPESNNSAPKNIGPNS